MFESSVFFEKSLVKGRLMPYKRLNAFFAGD